MGTGQKIAIGCGVAVVVVGLAVGAAVFGGLWWAKGKAEQFTGNEARIEELKEKANAVPFEEPEDGLVREDRLVKFLEIRKRVYSVYEKHQGMLESMNQKKQADWSDVTSGLGVINEIRTAQAEALAEVGMSEAEYRYMVEQVYKTLWASEVAKQTGGKSISEAAGGMYEQAADEMERARQAQKGASPGTEELTPEQREALEKSEAELEKGIADARRAGVEARESARELDVPPANIALFRKYEGEIKKYAMGGLEWVGL
ncbi:MAG TPA: hypothetical protein VMR21_17560 [Vicinamibacteria bacterium]|nr:hypothetical protein [Vicinamibacteria bacterium]